MVKTNLASHADAYHARLTLSPSNMISPENGMYVSMMEGLRTLVDDTGTVHGYFLCLPTTCLVLLTGVHCLGYDHAGLSRRLWHAPRKPHCPLGVLRVAGSILKSPSLSTCRHECGSSNDARLPVYFSIFLAPL